MAKLFAAHDIGGRVVFVDEVQRGAACDCFCPACKSPVVAKKGEVNDWHFAHQAGQERPECRVGALNLLRQLSIEHLQGLGIRTVPNYKQLVSEQGLTRTFEKSVEWPCPMLGQPVWHPNPSQSAPVATFRTVRGCAVDVYVVVDALAPVPTQVMSEGRLDFLVPLDFDSLKTRELAFRHIQQKGTYVWRHHPDVHGLVANARVELAGQVEEEKRRIDALAHARREMAGRRWAEIARNGAQRPKPISYGAVQPAAMASAPAAPSAKKIEDSEVDWAPGHRKGTGLIFYKLRDGSSWVTYRRTDGTNAMAPWPKAEEGWDECIPASVGKLDRAQEIYLIESFTRAAIWLGSQTVMTRTVSDFEELEKLKKQLE